LGPGVHAFWRFFFFQAFQIFTPMAVAAPVSRVPMIALITQNAPISPIASAPDGSSVPSDSACSCDVAISNCALFHAFPRMATTSRIAKPISG
jgi:hypothetical protein